MDDLQRIRQLEERVHELERSLSAKDKICQVLMKRVERSMDSVGGAYAIFERNILLQNLVDQRSKELEDANRKLKEEITERICSDEALRESEAFLDKLLNSIPIPVFYKDREGRYTGFNRAFEIFFNAPRTSLIGKTVFDINPPELAEIYYAKDNELFESGCEQRYETQVMNAIGDVRDVIIHKAVFTDCQGSVIGSIGAILDITDRNNTAKELWKSQKRYKDIFDNAIEGIFQSTLEGRYNAVNPALARMYGYESPEEMLSETTDIGSQEYVDPADRESLILLLMQGGVVKDFEVQVKRRDGSPFWISLNAHAVYDADGAVHYIEGIRVDITDRKIMTLERERLVGELQQALADVKTLSGMLPICANCKKIRDDTGYWNRIESYISKRSDAVFTHSICPECIKILYPDLAQK